jgi:hypothetical protein
MLVVAGCGADAGSAGSLDDDDVSEVTEELALLSNTLWTPLWTGRTSIPVCFTNGTTAQRSHVRSIAEGSWEAIGATTTGPNGRYGVDFTGWGTCPSSTTLTIRVTFVTTGPNSVTGLGRTHQRMNLYATASDDTIMHEFGHALGYTHEFRRSDYAATDPNCPETNGTQPDLGLTSVDRTSIMNYAPCGSAGGLTFGDIFAHASLYGPWNVTYGDATLGIRHDATWNFVRGDSTPDTSSPTIASDQEFTLVNVTDPARTGNVVFGDTVRIRTSDGQFLKSNGTLAVTKSSVQDGTTTWQILSGVSSGPIRVNDMMVFRANDGTYLRSNSSNELVTTSSYQVFRLVGLLAALNL